MSEWTDALAGLDVRTLVPRAPAHAEKTPPAKALVAAGGVPMSAPEAPLLVAVNDPDRATRSGEALSAIRAAAPGRRLRLVVATGSHRHGDEARRRHEGPLRDAVGDGVAIRWHDGDDAAQVAIGDQWADPWLAEARDVVGVGSVEPHWFAGLTGSYKTLSVGLMGRSGLEASHVLALEQAARPLQLDGNPVHASIARSLRALLAGRSVVALDHLGDTWVAGDPLENCRRLLPRARASWGIRVERVLDFLVARVRPPLDAVLYQAEKGLKNSEHAVRDGGAIVIDARCIRGVGPRRFVDLLERAADEATARSLILRDGYRLGDHKAVRLRALQARGVEIGVVAPSLPADAAEAAGVHVLDDARAAGGWLRQRCGDGASGAIVEDAAHAVVEVAA